MVISVIVLISFALIFGADGFAKSLVKPFIGLVLVVSVAPVLVGSCERMLARSGSQASDAPLVLGILIALIATIGAVLWKHRSHAHHGGSSGRPSYPRRRALPQPPGPESEE